MVRALGIDIDRVYLIVFTVGAALAGVAGLMHAPLVTFYPEMGGSILIESFVVVVIGGLNQFRGAIIAGILVGEVRALTFLVSPGATDIAVFLLMAFVLLIKPQGLLGTVGGVE
jgi:branched-chain amino acid transport system permease protein